MKFNLYLHLGLVNGLQCHASLDFDITLLVHFIRECAQYDIVLDNVPKYVM